MASPVALPHGVKEDHLMALLRRSAWEAADLLRAYARGQQPPYGYPARLAVEEGRDGPVSAADRAVHHHLLQALSRTWPHAPWGLLSEETTHHDDRDHPLDRQWAWLLDPLDGTRDFLEGTGHYAVHLALLHQGRPRLGLVLLPEREELWFGAGGRCWREDRQGIPRPAGLSGRRRCEDLILMASRNHRDKRLEALIPRLGLAGSRSVGSVGCKVAAILRGEADVYISLSGRSAPKHWDMAAPEAVLQAAGGCFRHGDGRPLTYSSSELRQTGCLIASHGPCQEQLEARARMALAAIDPGFAL
ncbi:3'(2'),5'-bisphosphate nucleotidase CysQ family protein [Candidatus Synechococcus spongiarum]|uniref:inositol-phosphate phosphatase n=1 Tax=Candidatus Synechococcus spongiarum TaxID=431041 RepID=A0A165B2J4_9SYNE|nr:3'(2'),5'-bisphosphate nucleotidase CysQ [Candidatus Synechococcus spongiarum]SAY38820.1 3'(2'),5'-bisphosphate nucleotidase (EC 3.1.3.7) [Candidatus Synechococcus spongiarum]